MLNLLSKRYLFFSLSLLVIIPGLVILAIYGLPLAIDFVGGTLLEVQFASGNAPQSAEIYSLYEDLGITDVQVQTTGKDILIIRSPALNETNRSTIISEMNTRFNDTIVI